MCDTTVARRGPSSSRSPRRSAGGCGRSSVRTWKSPSPKTTATARLMLDGDSDARAASLTSISRPLGACVPRRLAGIVAASFAITTSHGLNRSTSCDRGTCRMNPNVSTVRSLASLGRWTGAVAGIIVRPSARERPRPQASSPAGRRSAGSARGLTLPGSFRVERSASGTAAACSGVSMSPGSNEIRLHAGWTELLLPDARHVQQRCFARAVSAPSAVRVDGGVAGDVDDHRAPAFSAEEASEPRSAFVSRKGPSRFVASACSRSSQSVSASDASGIGPRLEALLIRTSTPPRALAI